MQDNKKSGFFEKIYKATYENMSDVKFVSHFIYYFFFFYLKMLGE